MSADFWLGLLALPVLAAAIAAAVLVGTKAWRALDDWLMLTRPQKVPIRTAYHVRFGARPARTSVSYASRAPIAAAVMVWRRQWTVRPWPGVSLIVQLAPSSADEAAYQAALPHVRAAGEALDKGLAADLPEPSL